MLVWQLRLRCMNMFGSLVPRRMRQLPKPRLSFPLEIWLLAGILFFLGPALGAQELAQNPLAPVKLESPRDTMRTFMESMNSYRNAKLRGEKNALDFLDRAVRCLDVQDASLVLQDEVGREAAIFLKEVIDRVIIIDYEKIPTEIAKDNPPWRLRNTEIMIGRVDSGDLAGNYLFTKNTVKNARKFYNKIKSYPYLLGAGEGALYSEPWLERNVPEWAKRTLFLFPNWK